MELITGETLSNLMITIFVGLMVLSIMLVIITEYRRTNGNLDINSFAWIALAILVPVIVPMIYLAAGKK